MDEIWPQVWGGGEEPPSHSNKAGGISGEKYKSDFTTKGLIFLNKYNSVNITHTFEYLPDIYPVST